MNDAGELAVLSQESLREFFRALLDAAIDNQRARSHVQDETQLYLVNLLGGFLDTETLYVSDADGNLDQKPLAFLLKEALEEQGAARAALLRRLGDRSLFVSGFFGESLNRSLVDVTYYKAMGERAYGSLGQHVSRHARARTLYEELSEKFGLFVDLLAEVSERTLYSTNAGLLKLYDKWFRTGGRRVEGLLREKGMLPLMSSGGKFVQ